MASGEENRGSAESLYPIESPNDEVERELLSLAEKSKLYRGRGKKIGIIRFILKFLVLVPIFYHGFGAINYFHFDQQLIGRVFTNLTDNEIDKSFLNSTLFRYYTSTALVAGCHLTLTLVTSLLYYCLHRGDHKLVQSIYRLIKSEIYVPGERSKEDEDSNLEDKKCVHHRFHRTKGIVDSLGTLLEVHGKPKGLFGCCHKVKHKKLPPDDTLSLMRKKLHRSTQVIYRPSAPPQDEYVSIYPQHGEI